MLLKHKSYSIKLQILHFIIILQLSSNFVFAMGFLKNHNDVTT